MTALGIIGIIFFCSVLIGLFVRNENKSFDKASRNRAIERERRDLYNMSRRFEDMDNWDYEQNIIRYGVAEANRRYRMHQRPSVTERSVVQDVVKRVDDETIKGLEATTLTDTMDDKMELLGYKWKVTRSGDNLIVNLIRPDGTFLGDRVERFYETDAYPGGPRPKTLKRTAEQMRNMTKSVMAELVKNELTKVRYERDIENLVETYNGKDVEVR